MSWNPSDQSGKKPEGPPDLDKLIAQFVNKIKRSLGFKPRAATFNAFSAKTQNDIPWGPIGGVIVALYLLSGIYIVGPAERAVITCLGAYQETVGPGPHWIARFIQAKKIVNVDEVMTSQHGGMMLTQDENIVHVKLAVQYRVADPKDYLFSLVAPENTLRNVVDSAVRYVIGHSTLDQILTSGRTLIAAQIKEQIGDNLDDYHAGLSVSAVALQEAEAPTEVKAAFLDAIRAREDEERLVNQAEAYASRIEPIARGQATRLIESAKAHKEEVVLLAKGETQRFNALLTEYDRGPEVMKDRMYLGTMQDVLSDTSKVIVNVKKGNPLISLPLEKMMGSPAPQSPETSPVLAPSTVATTTLPNANDPQSDSYLRFDPTRPLRPERLERPTRSIGDQP